MSGSGGNRGYGGGGGGGGFRKQKWQNRGNRGGAGGAGGPGQTGAITATGGYAPPKRASGPKTCPMCGIVASNLGQHMVQAHDHPVET